MAVPVLLNQASLGSVLAAVVQSPVAPHCSIAFGLILDKLAFSCDSQAGFGSWCVLHTVPSGLHV